jgi:hypothetical protein
MINFTQATQSAPLLKVDEAAFALARIVQRTERTRLLYQGSRVSLLLMIVASLVFVALLWGEAPRLELALWSGWTLLLALLRLQQANTFDKTDAEDQQRPHWLRAFVLGNAVTAITLGYAIVALVPSDDFLQQTLLFGATGSVVVAGSVTSGVSFRAFLVFVLPSLLPAAFVLLGSDQAQQQGWGVLTVIVLMTLSMIAWQTNRLLTASLQHRFHNQQLIDRLENMRREAAELNGELAREVEQRRLAEAQLREAFDGLEQRVAERTAELRESETRLTLALEASELGLWDWDLEHGEVHHSRMEVVFGIGQNDRLRLIDQQRPEVHPDDLPQVRKDIIAHLLRVAPAHQRLGGIQAIIRHVQPRLVKDLELPLLERPAQLVFQLEVFQAGGLQALGATAPR